MESKKELIEEEKKYKFVLVHGTGHGAWCWYKLAALLESHCHSVIALDMTASGIDLRSVHEVRTLHNYYRPLMDYFSNSTFPSDERVILVGHSFGGIGVALATEAFPEKIAIAIFTSAQMPNPTFSLAEVLDESARRFQSMSMLDSKYFFDDGPDKPPTSLLVGPKYLSYYLYQNCPLEDLKLATMLVRQLAINTGESFEDIQFTEERFGSVARAYIMCEDDRTITKDFQRLLIEKTTVNEVMELDGADHMVMLSKPHELFSCLLAISEKFVCR